MSSLSVYILLDRSDSMTMNWAETLGAINGYADQLARKLPNEDKTVTLVCIHALQHMTFDVVRDRVPPAVWQLVTRQDAAPRGSTPLNVAIVRLCAVAGHDSAQRGMVVIMTDSEEERVPRVHHGPARAALDRVRARGGTSCQWPPNFPRLWPSKIPLLDGFGRRAVINRGDDRSSPFLAACPGA